MQVKLFKDSLMKLRLISIFVMHIDIDDEEHLRHLEILFQRLSNFGLVINVSKCVFAQNSVCFLGYLVNKYGIQPPKDRILAIKNYSLPHTAAGLRRFIEMLDFYRRFLPRVSEFTSPLHDAISQRKIKGTQTITWTAELVKAFNACKNHLSNLTF